MCEPVLPLNWILLGTAHVSFGGKDLRLKTNEYKFISTLPCRQNKQFQGIASAHVTFCGSGGKRQLPTWSRLTHVVPRQRLGASYFGARRNVTMQILNSVFCDIGKYYKYSAVNHTLWMNMLFYQQGLLLLGSTNVTVTYK